MKFFPSKELNANEINKNLDDIQKNCFVISLIAEWVDEFRNLERIFEYTP